MAPVLAKRNLNFKKFPIDGTNCYVLEILGRENWIMFVHKTHKSSITKVIIFTMITKGKLTIYLNQHIKC